MCDRNSGMFFAKVGRFVLVGTTAAIAYFTVVIGLVAYGNWSPGASSVMGYLVGLVVSYVGQAAFTFAVQPFNTIWMIRYIAVWGVGLVASYIIMTIVVHGLQMSYVWGAIATCVALPPITYVLLNLWVFRGLPHSPTPRKS